MKTEIKLEKFKTSAKRSERKNNIWTHRNSQN
ncbi:hypothetical protein AYI68_g328, partial [Smittium mucronatum]